LDNNSRLSRRPGGLIVRLVGRLVISSVIAPIIALLLVILRSIVHIRVICASNSQCQ
jgi:hypothetical protein